MKRVYILSFEDSKESYNDLHNRFFYNKNPRVSFVRDFKQKEAKVYVELDLTEEEATFLAISINCKITLSTAYRNEIHNSFQIYK